MPIEFNCTQCGKLLRVPDGSAGKRAKCPKCESVNLIPGDDHDSDSSAAGESDPLADPPPPQGSGPLDLPSGYEGGPAGVNPYMSTQKQALPAGMKPHKGVAAMLMGIFSIVTALPGLLSCCCFCFIGFPVLSLALGIPAWIMGQSDMKKMDFGEVDPSGYGQAKAGMITGMIGSILGSLALLLWIGYIVFAIVTHGFDQAFQVPDRF